VAVLAAVVVLYVVATRRVALVGAVACAVALTAASDVHGVSLLSGMVIALVITLCRTERRDVPKFADCDTVQPQCRWAHDQTKAAVQLSMSGGGSVPEQPCRPAATISDYQTPSDLVGDRW
jgi:hypothetical protein